MSCARRAQAAHQEAARETSAGKAENQPRHQRATRAPMRHAAPEALNQQVVQLALQRVVHARHGHVLPPRWLWLLNGDTSRRHPTVDLTPRPSARRGAGSGHLASDHPGRRQSGARAASAPLAYAPPRSQSPPPAATQPESEGLSTLISWKASATSATSQQRPGLDQRRAFLALRSGRPSVFPSGRRFPRLTLADTDARQAQLELVSAGVPVALATL